MRQKQLIVYLLLLLLVIGLFSILLLPDEKETLPHVVFAEMKSPIAGPLALAHLKGYYAEEGLDVEVQSFSIARLAVDAMLSNAADFGFAADIVVMNTFVHNQPLYSIATYSHGGSNKILARKDRGITQLQDLRGKKIGTLKGTALDSYLFKVLEHEGISFKDVTLVNLQTPDMPAALLRGDIDAFSSVEPFITLTQAKMGANAVVLHNKDAYDVTSHILVRKEIIEQHPDYIEKFLRAVKRADIFIRENPLEAKQLLAEYTNLDVHAMDVYFNEVVFNLEQNKSRSILELNQEYELGKQMGLIPQSTQKPDFTRFIYTYDSTVFTE